LIIGREADPKELSVGDFLILIILATVSADLTKAKRFGNIQLISSDLETAIYDLKKGKLKRASGRRIVLGRTSRFGSLLQEVAFNIWGLSPTSHMVSDTAFALRGGMSDWMYLSIPYPGGLEVRNPTRLKQYLFYLLREKYKLSCYERRRIRQIGQAMADWLIDDFADDHHKRRGVASN
jgi:hypothetical protein